MPRVRSFWRDDLGNDLVRNIMGVEKFEKIWRYINFNNNDQHLPRDNPSHDRLNQIQPTTKKFSSVALAAIFVPKASKMGILFATACVSGFAYQFEMYSRQENSIDRLNNVPDFG